MTDQDGNEIAEGMAVVSCGDSWVVGAICPARVNGFICLDRVMPDGRKQRLIVGRRRWCCIHVIGYRLPLIFR